MHLTLSHMLTHITYALVHLTLNHMLHLPPICAQRPLMQSITVWMTSVYLMCSIHPPSHKNKGIIEKGPLACVCHPPNH